MTYLTTFQIFPIKKLLEIIEYVMGSTFCWNHGYCIKSFKLSILNLNFLAIVWLKFLYMNVNNF